MRSARIETADGRLLCERCWIADSFLSRSRGLLGRAELPRGEGMLIRPAGSVHMFFMRFAIDAVFCDRDLRVVGIAANLRPWRMAARRHARATLELAAGEAAARGVAVGDALTVVDP
jgi:hypothetical protein